MEKSTQFYQKCLNLTEEIYGKNKDSSANILNNLGLVCYRMG